MLSNRVAGRWTDASVKYLGVWFDTDFQWDNNLDEVTSRAANLTQKWAEMKLFLKCRAKVVNVYIVSSYTIVWPSSLDLLCD